MALEESNPLMRDEHTLHTRQTPLTSLGHLALSNLGETSVFLSTMLLAAIIH